METSPDNPPSAHPAQEAGPGADLGRAVSYGAAMCLLRGRACAGLDNRARAAAWFRAALRADPFCYEAFQARSRNPVSRRPSVRAEGHMHVGYYVCARSCAVSFRTTMRRPFCHEASITCGVPG